jgi:hypothetical protein
MDERLAKVVAAALAAAREQGAREMRERCATLAEAAFTLLVALESADANEDLGFDDMEKIERLRHAFPRCEKCNGLGSFDGMDHADEVVESCPNCGGYGIHRALPLSQETPK